MLGSVVDPSSPSAIAWSRSDDGGGSWAAVDHLDLGYRIDKPSLAVSSDGAALWVAYVRIRYSGATPASEIEVIRSTSGGAAWSAPVTIPGRVGTRQNPIVRVHPADDDIVLVAFQDGGSMVGFAGSTNAGASFSMWSTPVSGAYHPAQHEAHDATYLRNLTWMDFIVDPGNLHCDVVYESTGNIWFVTSGDGMSWSPPVPVADAGDERFQASIRASEDRLAVTYYEQPAGSPITRVFAVVSPDHGATWPVPMELTQPSAHGPVPFEPCVSGDPGSGYFGDYTGLVPLALPGDEGPSPWFYAAWADSRRGCEPGRFAEPMLAIHQHTMGAAFQ